MGLGLQMLGSLGVQKLVLPAVAAVGSTWTGAFGFRAMEETERRQLAEMGILVFPGTQTLEKALVGTGNVALPSILMYSHAPIISTFCEYLRICARVKYGIRH